jgi:hypothetical protein
MKCSPWQVWRAIVKFEENDEVKSRPVLILDTKQMIAFSLKMSSHAPRPGDYELIDWKKAGLKTPTAVRFHQKLELSESDLQWQYGSVSLLDKLYIQKILSDL